jgi:uncharacterized membrane protein YedE/YeeE
MRAGIVTGVCVFLGGSASAWATPVPVDPNAYPGGAWSPYLVGGLIGVLSMLTFYFSNKPLGASTSYARVAGLIGTIFARRHTESLSFYRKKGAQVDWQTMLVLGVIGGAFLSAWTGGELTGRLIPPLWGARFGAGSVALRLIFAFAGGAVMAFGARLAGGCTSGHGISGTLQLSVGSWIALICFFVSGVAVAMLMYRT